VDQSAEDKKDGAGTQDGTGDSTPNETPAVPTAPVRCVESGTCAEPSPTPFTLQPNVPVEDITKIDPKLICAITGNCPEEKPTINLNPAVFCLITGTCGDKGQGNTGNDGPLTVECLNNPDCSWDDGVKRAP
jgi:hypothetical protein